MEPEERERGSVGGQDVLVDLEKLEEGARAPANLCALDPAQIETLYLSDAGQHGSDDTG